ncbi:MAG: diguanylate cyclase [Atopobiaceae bacterium]|nr:diguanylate cyclase [Atopobiaceae bacterium]
MDRANQGQKPRGDAAPLWRRPMRIRMLNAVAIVIASALALVALTTLERIFVAEGTAEQVNNSYLECSSAARDLQEASDYLTSQVRVYVFTGNREYMDNYISELLELDRRGKAVETLKHYMGEDSEAALQLEEALRFSNELAERELYAMRLTATATGLTDVPSPVAEVELSAEDATRGADEQRSLAEQIVLGDEYQSSKSQISGAVKGSASVLLDELNQSVLASNETLRARLAAMQFITGLLLAIVVFVIFATIFLILWPLASYTQQIKDGEPLVLTGASELQYLADAYNAIYQENRERTLHLQHAAERDALTGLYNRGAYDMLLTEHTRDVALLLIDVDFFKTVNDTYGHDMGDAVLKKVATIIHHSFRNSDFPCRVGGDEFAVIMTEIGPELRDVVAEKVEHVAEALRDTSDGLPKVSLSIGIAFSEDHQGSENLYRAADRALYEIKQRGRNGYAFSDEAMS